MTMLVCSRRYLLHSGIFTTSLAATTFLACSTCGTGCKRRLLDLSPWSSMLNQVPDRSFALVRDRYQFATLAAPAQPCPLWSPGRRPHQHSPSSSCGPRASRGQQGSTSLGP